MGWREIPAAQVEYVDPPAYALPACWRALGAPMNNGVELTMSPRMLSRMRNWVPSVLSMERSPLRYFTAFAIVIELNDGVSAVCWEVVRLAEVKATSEPALLVLMLRPAQAAGVPVMPVSMSVLASQVEVAASSPVSW